MDSGEPTSLPPLRYRAAVYLAVLVVVGLILSPAFREPPADSFPLSDYPMFSHGRPDSKLILTHALGVDANGRVIALPPPVSAGNAEVLQSMVTIGRSIHEGRTTSFCHEVAERVAHSNDLLAVVEVRLATSEYDCVRYFADHPRPLSRTIHATCTVPR